MYCVVNHKYLNSSPVWQHYDLGNMAPVPCTSGCGHPLRRALADLSGTGHPHCPQPHQDLPHTQGEFKAKEGIHLDPFSPLSSISLTTKGSSSKFWEDFSLQA